MNNKGFTLLEIIAVTVIILMISLMIIPVIEKYIEKTKTVLSNSQISTIENAAYIYAYNFQTEIPEINTTGVAVITVQTLISKGLIQANAFTINGETMIPTNATVVIVKHEGEIKTKYDIYSQTKPIILLRSLNEITISKGTTYIEYGALLVKFSPSTSVEVLSVSNITSNVNTTVAGNYEVQYSYTNAITVKRAVIVNEIGSGVDNIKPLITLVGSATVTLSKGSTYTDAGATASDNKDGDITSRIVTTNEVNTKQKGTYYVKYDVVDLGGNSAIQVKRTVIIN